MRILGIDPGLQITGFGLIDVDGPQLSYVASGTIRTAEAPRGDLPARIRLIFDGVREVVSTYQPDAAALEIVFVNVNPQSTLLLGQARGAALAALVAGSPPLPVGEYTAVQMKQAVTGHGGAAKAQIQAMVSTCSSCPASPARTPPTRWASPSRTPTPAAASPRWPRPRRWHAGSTRCIGAGGATDARARGAVFPRRRRALPDRSFPERPRHHLSRAVSRLARHEITDVPPDAALPAAAGRGPADPWCRCHAHPGKPRRTRKTSQPAPPESAGSFTSPPTLLILRKQTTTPG